MNRVTGSLDDGGGIEVPRIDLDAQDEAVNQFVLNLPLDQSGSILESSGEPVARVFPIQSNRGYDRELLKQAILNRRDESRQLNQEWEHVDREVWHKT